jgi:excisionase family DNA binding protein
MTTVDHERRLLLTIDESADRLGIGRSLMYQLVLSGEVESVKVGPAAPDPGGVPPRARPATSRGRTAPT